MRVPRRILAVGHQYAIAPYRRLPHEMARVGKGRWTVDVAAPLHWQGNPKFGDLRPVTLETIPGESTELHGVRMYLTQRVHVAIFGDALRKLMKSHWDVVHIWQEPFVLAGGQLAMFAPKRAKVIFTTFQNIAKTYPPPFNLIERYSLGRANGWVANGVTIEDTLMQRTAYRARPHERIWPGVDIEAFRPDAARRAAALAQLDWEDDGPPIVGFLGRLVESKGIPLLLNALDATTQPWRALFVGSGELEPAIRRWAERYPQRVRVLTGIRHDQVPGYVNAFDLLAAPSQTTPRWREQFGRMLVEAMASGVPVIGSDSGEIPYVIDGAGVIAPESDGTAWTREIDRLLADPALRTRLGDEGRERAHDTFAWPHVAARYLEFFESLSENRDG